MFKHIRRALPALLVMGLVLTACNMPTAVKEPTISNDDIAKTAAAMVISNQAAAPQAAAPVAEELATATPSPTATQCNPTVTATTLANVRSGPGLAYDVIGSLPQGGAATVAGTDSSRTWWYIQFAGGYGGYAWIAGSVVSPACVQPTLPQIAAPPLPTAAPATPTEVVSNPPLLNIPPLLLHKFPSPTPTHLLLLNPNLIKPVQPIVPIPIGP